MSELADDPWSALRLPDGARVLFLAPGPHGLACAQGLAAPPTPCRWTVLHDYTLRQSQGALPWSNASAAYFRGQAARLPFARHAFDAVLSFETLFAVRPPWTVLAELHRVLKPDGVLLLVEPASEGFFSMLRARLLGPGKRVYPKDELTGRLTRADFAVEAAEAHAALPGFPRAAWRIVAKKLEFPADAPPTWTTAKELYARQRKPGAAAEAPAES
ncbi:MAG: class I SAM-dependent methyltransferase [Planctomycetes bacterium]|nr:class I SAM-dependent methyltransferase [Planctomycetota bacterium]